jgi:hypothetical protein
MTDPDASRERDRAIANLLETGKTYKEIAAIIGITEGAVWHRLKKQKQQSPMPEQTKSRRVNWTDIQPKIFSHYPGRFARTAWTKLSKKKHGVEVAMFALERITSGDIETPVTVNPRERQNGMNSAAAATARLIIPWLNSPLARQYDLLRPSHFARLKEDYAMILESCKIVFESTTVDISNRCAALLRSAKHEPHRQRLREIREQERLSVNGCGNPPIVVHGVELWPDGDLPAELRLPYDAARFAYFMWREFDSAITIAIPDVLQRASFWQQRQRVFHGLKFSSGAALSNFWLRAGQAMERNPEGQSHCVPIVRRA